YLLDVILHRSSLKYEPSEFDLMDHEVIQLQADHGQGGRKVEPGLLTIGQVGTCCTSSRLSFRL
ncbi:hypothetical protein RRG08_062387, partial [Elysia crispata]